MKTLSFVVLMLFVSETGFAKKKDEQREAAKKIKQEAHDNYQITEFQKRADAEVEAARKFKSDKVDAIVQESPNSQSASKAKAALEDQTKGVSILICTIEEQKNQALAMFDKTVVSIPPSKAKDDYITANKNSVQMRNQDYSIASRKKIYEIFTGKSWDPKLCSEIQAH